MNLKKETVVAQYNDGEWIVMFNDGSVQVFTDAESVVKVVSRSNKRRVKNGGVILTMIEWTDAPQGFVPPEVK